MKDSIIFYFSGTGNSLQIAEDIADGLGDTELIPIGDFDLNTEVASKRVGIVFPVYFWGLPRILAEFADRVKLSNGATVYAVSNYGGTTGAALAMLKDRLEKRGISLQAAYSIRMPGNYIREYGARPEKSQRKLFEKEKPSAERIVGEIKAGKTNLQAAKSNPLIRAISEKVNGSFREKCAASDEGFHVSDACISCDLCEKGCPVHNITLESGRPVWHHRCEACMACIERCPKQAINYQNSTQNRKRYVNPNVKF
jgi:ferredoxin/flavodoxin